MYWDRGLYSIVCCVISGKMSQHKYLCSDKLRPLKIPWRSPNPSPKKTLSYQIYETLWSLTANCLYRGLPCNVNSVCSCKCIKWTIVVPFAVRGAALLNPWNANQCLGVVGRNLNILNCWLREVFVFFLWNTGPLLYKHWRRFRLIIISRQAKRKLITLKACAKLLSPNGLFGQFPCLFAEILSMRLIVTTL